MRLFEVGRRRRSGAGLTAVAVAEPARPWQSRIPLAALLATAVVAELLLNRIGARLARTELMVPRAWHIGLDFAGLAAFHFASVLAVLLLGLALVRMLAQPTPPGAATTGKAITLIALAGFVTLAGLGVLRQLPNQLLVYELSLFSFLLLQLTVAAWSHAPGRTRLWLSLFLLAAGLHFLWVVARVMRLDEASPYPRYIVQLGEALAVTLAAASPFCLLPSRARLGVPLAAGLITAAAGFGAGLANRQIVAQIADGGFGLEMPEPAVGVALFALALGSFTAAVVGLLGERGPVRLRGVGLVLIGISGYQMELPFQVASTVLGLLCLSESLIREDALAGDADTWLPLVRRIAGWVGAREVVTAGGRGREEMRARIPLDDGAGAEVMVRRDGGRVALVEVAVGFAPSNEAPPLSLHARSGARLGRKDGAEVKTGDLAFDEALAVFDTRRLDRSDPVLDDATRPRLRELATGWTGIWPGRGARLRLSAGPLAASLDAGAEEAGHVLRETIALLDEVRRRA